MNKTFDYKGKKFSVKLVETKNKFDCDIGLLDKNGKTLSPVAEISMEHDIQKLDKQMKRAYLAACAMSGREKTDCNDIVKTRSQLNTTGHVLINEAKNVSLVIELFNKVIAPTLKGSWEISDNMVGINISQQETIEKI